MQSPKQAGWVVRKIFYPRKWLDKGNTLHEQLQALTDSKKVYLDGTLINKVAIPESTFE